MVSYAKPTRIGLSFNPNDYLATSTSAYLTRAEAQTLFCDLTSTQNIGGNKTFNENVTVQGSIINQDIESLYSTNDSQSTQIMSLSSDNTSNKSRLSTLETDNTSNKSSITTLLSDNTSNKSRLTTVENISLTNDSQINSLNATNITQNSRLTSLEYADTGFLESIENLELSVNNNTSSINTNISNISTLDSSLNTQITRMNTVEPKVAFLTVGSDLSNFSSNVNVNVGKEYRINSQSVLSASTLGNNVTYSLLTQVGTQLKFGAGNRPVINFGTSLNATISQGGTFNVDISFGSQATNVFGIVFFHVHAPNNSTIFSIGHCVSSTSAFTLQSTTTLATGITGTFTLSSSANRRITITNNMSPAGTTLGFNIRYWTLSF